MNGQLDSESTFLSICAQFADRNTRTHDDNPHKMKGIRYTPQFADFCLITRGHGGRSASHYGILSNIVGGMSFRTLRRRVQKSNNGVFLPTICSENFQRMVKYAELVGYDGPWIACGDATKIQPMLNVSTRYSNGGGAHIIGSPLPLPLSETWFTTSEEQDAITDRIAKEQAVATQVWVPAMTIPLPGMPVFAIGFIPSQGKDTASIYAAAHIKIRALCEQNGLKLLATGLDGARSEVNAHRQLCSAPCNSRLVYSNPRFGIHISCPVWTTTGPLVPVSDPPHARKNMKTNFETGTHLLVFGDSFVTHSLLMDLLAIPGCPLYVKDVYNAEKQDNGPARRILHPGLLKTLVTDKNELIDQKFKGFFIMSFVFGSATDAWTKRSMAHIDRVTSVSRMWSILVIFYTHLKGASQAHSNLVSLKRNFYASVTLDIFFTLAHQMILLLGAYHEHHPGVPFMPWHFGTPWLEHFFGLARSFDKDMTYARLLEMNVHIELQQMILAKRGFCHKREKDSNNGYSFDPYINNLTPEELVMLKDIPSEGAINDAFELGWNEAVALATLCDVTPPDLALDQLLLPPSLQQTFHESKNATSTAHTPPTLQSTLRNSLTQNNPPDWDESESSDLENEVITSPITQSLPEGVMQADRARLANAAMHVSMLSELEEKVAQVS
ncbi:hypothetical protein BDV93DRAFT_559500 [Ceratobasidium sp. AG-I]|nr:hypothetical protein BDV93DRAFT_559500 [Ceratobasidium sp. AG-I]